MKHAFIRLNLLHDYKQFLVVGIAMQVRDLKWLFAIPTDVFSYLLLINGKQGVNRGKKEN